MPIAVASSLAAACSGIASGYSDDGARKSSTVSTKGLIDHSESDRNAQDATRDTRLHQAVLRGDTETVSRLLTEGANPNATDKQGASPAFLALQRNDNRTLALLLQYGADPNFTNRTAGGHVKVYSPGVRWTNLDEQPLNCPTQPLEGGLFQFYEGKSLLELAISNVSISQVDTLIAAGANLDAEDCYGNTPLRTAIVLGRFEIANRLLEAGADPTITNRWAASLLETAESRGIGDPAWKATVIMKLKQFLSESHKDE